MLSTRRISEALLGASVAAVILMPLCFHLQGYMSRTFQRPRYQLIKLEPSWHRLNVALMRFKFNKSLLGRTHPCRLPSLDPWEPSLLKYLNGTGNPEWLKDRLFFTSHNHLHLNTTTLGRLGLQWREVSCNLSYVSRWNGWRNKCLSHLNWTQISALPIFLSPNFTSLVTRCTSRVSGKGISRRLHYYIPPTKPKAKEKKRSGRKYSVVIFIIDSLSQMNVRRSLPATLEAAQSIGGVFFKGHHKVGLNSEPNVMALLSGSAASPWNQKRPWNPLIINAFHKHGWTTMVFEDEHRAFSHAKPFDISFIHSLNFGKIHTPPTDVVRDFLTAYSDRPTFLHLHVSEYTHSFQSKARYYDTGLAEILKNLSSSGALRDTFFLVLGDHGPRFEPFSATVQGNIENNMPGFLLVPPTSMRKSHPDFLASLKANSKVLTSHYDIHQTLRHLLALGIGEKAVASLYSGKTSPGRSLLQPLGSRSCSGAGVPLQFCSCPQVQVVLEEEVVGPLVKAVMEDVHDILGPLEDCQRLHVDTVTDGTMKIDGVKVIIEAFVEVTRKPVKFLVKIDSKAGGGWSNATALVTRLDQYSLTSHCVGHQYKHMKPYCVCPQ